MNNAHNFRVLIFLSLEGIKWLLNKFKVVPR